MRVCIPMAGLGTRLGKMTHYCNKALIGVAGVPTLSRIIAMFPSHTEFVLALGYKAELIREYVSLAHPDSSFIFADVPVYEGPDSGLGYSLLCCEAHLQQPFVFISCDTLVKEPIPSPESNWMGWSDCEDLSAYRTLRLQGNEVYAVQDKGHAQPGDKSYIGLAGIADYKIFWKAMHERPAIEQGEAFGLQALLSAGCSVIAHDFTWYDTGTPEGLAAATQAYATPDEPVILDKPNEAIWFLGSIVIKFSDDTTFIEQRVQRAEGLRGFIPEITGHTQHMYRYTKIHGDVLSKVVTPERFTELLRFCEIFWKPITLSPSQQISFKQTCKDFYCTKTFKRIKNFYETFHRKDSETCINGLSMPPLDVLLQQIDWETITTGVPGRFHGDLHFDNILLRNNGQFAFIDWRQNFGGELHLGDVYYDLAKLLHGLIVNHELIAKGAFSVSWNGNSITYKLQRRDTLVCCERMFYRWLNEKGYSVQKVRILTALVYLNIAALHHYPYCLLLYALGKDMLFADVAKR